MELYSSNFTKNYQEKLQRFQQRHDLHNVADAHFHNLNVQTQQVQNRSPIRYSADHEPDPI